MLFMSPVNSLTVFTRVLGVCSARVPAVPHLHFLRDKNRNKLNYGKLRFAMADRAVSVFTCSEML
jgi:hypothetical protein